jgi:hypothetical protein
VAVVGVCLVGLLVALSSNEVTIQRGTFLVLTLTLAMLIVYTHATATLAAIERTRLEVEGARSAVYEMFMVPREDVPQGRTMFVVGNPSWLMVRAKVWCQFRVYGQRVDYHPDFDGTNTWKIFPRQQNRCHFEVKPLLARSGKTIEDMLREATGANRGEQLTMDLVIEYRDEQDRRYRLPSRRAFFDFPNWVWIPQLTESDGEEWAVPTA